MPESTAVPAEAQALIRRRLREWPTWLTVFLETHKDDPTEEAEAAFHNYAYDGVPPDLEPLCGMIYSELLAAYQRSKSCGRRAVYRAYLNTDQWAGTRSKVLARAKGRCEGCGEAKATEVHHLTYDHIGNEFLFELVALCSECHGRISSVGQN